MSRARDTDERQALLRNAFAATSSLSPKHLSVLKHFGFDVCRGKDIRLFSGRVKPGCVVVDYGDGESITYPMHGAHWAVAEFAFAMTAKHALQTGSHVFGPAESGDERWQ